MRIITGAKYSIIHLGTMSPFYANLTYENKKSDILIGGMFENSRTRHHFGATVSYMRDDVTWAVKTSIAGEKWRKVFAVYSRNVWSSTFGLWLGLTGLLYWFYKVVHPVDARLAAVGTMVLSAIMGLPGSNGKYILLIGNLAS